MKVIPSVFACLLAGVLLACSTSTRSSHSRATVKSAAAKVANGGLAAFVILSADVFSFDTNPIRFTPLWNPSVNEVTDVLDELPDYLTQATNEQFLHHEYIQQLPKMRERLPNTLSQIVGVSFKGQKGLLLNCLPANYSFTEQWRTHFIKVRDGGSRYWSVIYLLESRQFTGLHIDLGY